MSSASRSARRTRDSTVGHRVPPPPAEGGAGEVHSPLGQRDRPPEEGREGLPLGGAEEAPGPTVSSLRAGTQLGGMVGSALKGPRLQNFCPKAEEEVREGVERELRRLPRHLGVAASWIPHAEIRRRPGRGETLPGEVMFSRQRGIRSWLGNLGCAGDAPIRSESHTVGTPYGPAS